MKNEEYERILSEYLKEYEIKNVEELPNLIRIDIRPMKRDWGICTFIFTESHIACFGDVQAFTWRVTWDAAKQIKNGNCNAKDICYLTGKLENSNRLKEFEFNEEVMEEIKEELSEDLDEEELEEFNEKWEENEYLLGDVDKYHLGGLDDFFDEIGVEDGYEYYDRFESLAAHYYCAVAMLRCIEDYFSKAKKENVEIGYVENLTINMGSKK